MDSGIPEPKLLGHMDLLRESYTHSTDIEVVECLGNITIHFNFNNPQCFSNTRFNLKNKEQLKELGEFLLRMHRKV